jgi:hypothetical protein
MDNDNIINKLFSSSSRTKEGKIFKIVSQNTKKFYICSGYDENKILLTNIQNAKIFEELKSYYYASYEIIKYNDVSIETVSTIPVKNLDELKEYELEYILEHQNNCVNIFDPRDGTTIISKNPDKTKKDIEKRAKQLDDIIESATLKYVNDGMDYNDAKHLVRKERTSRMDIIREEVKSYF